jgi:RimJ/RimL family protein N-acetyltransferase
VALTGAALRDLTDLDHVTRAAIAAVDVATGAIVAEGRYATWSDCPHKADLALVVADDLQGRRIGTTLGLAMVRHARRSGVAALTASTLSDNLRARSILRRLGFRSVDRSHGVIDLELALAPLAC